MARTMPLGADEGDLGVGLPLGDPVEDLRLPAAEPEGLQGSGVAEFEVENRPQGYRLQAWFIYRF